MNIYIYHMYLPGTLIDPMLHSSEEEAKSNEAWLPEGWAGLRLWGGGCCWSALNTLIWLPLREVEMKVDCNGLEGATGLHKINELSMGCPRVTCSYNIHLNCPVSCTRTYVYICILYIYRGKGTLSYLNIYKKKGKRNERGQNKRWRISFSICVASFVVHLGCLSRIALNVTGRSYPSWSPTDRIPTEIALSHCVRCQQQQGGRKRRRGWRSSSWLWTILHCKLDILFVYKVSQSVNLRTGASVFVFVCVFVFRCPLCLCRAVRLSARPCNLQHLTFAAAAALHCLLLPLALLDIST